MAHRNLPKLSQRQVLIFFLVLLTCLFNLTLSQEKCHPNDKKALLQLKEHFGNPSLFFDWDPKTDCCMKWGGAGIECNDQGHITSLALDVLGAVEEYRHGGGFPKAIFELRYLETLFIAHMRDLTGPIPQELAKLTNLRSIELDHTNLTGPIPSFFAQFKNLTEFALIDNQFTGQIPTFLAQLDKLETLSITYNKLSGSIPDIFTHKKALRVVNLEGNNLLGSIPASLGHLPKLEKLHLRENRLSGPIPVSLARPNFKIIDLSKNRLTGDASFLFRGDNTVAKEILLNNNLLKFDFSKVDVPRNLTELNLSHNMLYGSLPLQLGQLLHLNYLDLSHNQLCGPIPKGKALSERSPDVFSHNKCLCGRPLPLCK